MLLDFHTHIFPDALASRTLEKLTAVAGIPVWSDGTLSGTLRRMDIMGVDKAITLHIATNPHQMHKVNDFAAACQCDRIVSFGSVHPDAPDALEELERIRALGLHGIKLHPDYQSFFVDDPKMAPIYEKIQELQLPLIFHTGWDPLSPREIHGSSEMVAQVARAYPDLNVIAAHMGGLNRYDEAMEWIIGSRIYIDISMSMEYCPDALFAQMVAAHPKDRLLFGSDCPWSPADRQLEKLKALPLTPDELDLICWQNGERILNTQKKR